MYKKNIFVQRKIQSDVPNLASHTDSQLINPWGNITSDDGIWVADNGSGLIIVYDYKGMPLNHINVLALPIGTGNVNPTGITFNHCKHDFMITNTTTHVSGPAKVITVTENGTINAFNSRVDNLNALPVVAFPGKVFTGVIVANSMLYVCNFNSGFVEIYDSTFTFKNQFTDPTLTALGYAPFNIHVIHHKLYITFAKQNAELNDAVNGLGNGYISVFNLDGTFVKQFYGRGVLNSPWGMLNAEIKLSKCEKEKDILLVANFGDGVINVFDLCDGAFLFPLKDCYGNIITIDGLWGITKCDNTIYFTAGIDYEAHGLLGKLKQ